MSSPIWKATPKVSPNSYMRIVISSPAPATTAPEAAAAAKREPVLRATVLR